MENETTVGIAQPDRAILDVLIRGENKVLSNPEFYVDMILRDRPQEEQDELVRFYRRGVNATTPEDMRDFRVKKFLGFPRAAIALPCWGVSVKSARETTTGMGNLLQETEDYLIYGSLFSGQFDVSVYTDNANLTVALQSVAQWVLLNYRETLELDYGLAQQSIMLTDFLPPAEAAPEFSFMRVVTLSCLYENSYAVEKEQIEQITYNDYSDDEELAGAGTGAQWQDQNGNPLEG